MFAGLIAFAFVFLGDLIAFVTNGSADYRQSLEQLARSRPANDPYLNDFLRWLNTPNGLATVAVLSSIIAAIMIVGLASIGGALAAKIVRPRGPRT